MHIVQVQPRGRATGQLQPAMDQQHKHRLGKPHTGLLQLPRQLLLLGYANCP